MFGLLCGVVNVIAISYPIHAEIKLEIPGMAKCEYLLIFKKLVSSLHVYVRLQTISGFFLFVKIHP